jgi:5-methylcytosine-specific restriction endonuclease McrA
MRKKTTEQFIKESKELYQDLYNYSKCIYINTMTKVIITCKNHGDWEVTPDNHLTKRSGCPKCKGFNLNKKEKINLAHQVHNNRYDYSLIKDQIILNTKKYDIKCNIHGVFQQVWNNHYTMGQGCPKCNIAGRKKTLSEGQKNSWSEEYTKQYMAEYFKNNQDKIKSYIPNKEKINSNRRKRWSEDPEFKLILGLRSRINECIKKYNFNKKDKSINELGCSIKEYIIYLESKFTSNMSWGNYGTYWEIDHIIPLSKNGSFHYTNTQPLTITENRKKGNRI